MSSTEGPDLWGRLGSELNTSSEGVMDSGELEQRRIAQQHGVTNQDLDVAEDWARRFALKVNAKEMTPQDAAREMALACPNIPIALTQQILERQCTQKDWNAFDNTPGSTTGEQEAEKEPETSTVSARRGPGDFLAKAWSGLSSAAMAAGTAVKSNVSAMYAAGASLFSNNVETDGKNISRAELGGFVPATTPGMAVAQGRDTDLPAGRSLSSTA